MVITAQHDRTDLAVSDHFIKFQRDVAAAQRIGIKDPCLRAHHQFVLFRVADPDPVVAILIAALGIDDRHGGMIGFAQILRLARQADPAEGTVTEIKQTGP